VTFKDGATVLGTRPLDARGIATFTTASLRVGSYPITVVYQGNGNFRACAAALTQTVKPAATAAALAPSSANPSVYRQTVTFAAIVVAVAPGGGTPTGTVTFKDGATVLGTRPLDARGIATFTTASLRVGSHAITVLYNGDTGHTGSTSAKLIQTVRA
jgi:hypothetical protein